MPLALTGSLSTVQFRCPAELPLTLDKIEHFETAPWFRVSELKSKVKINIIYGPFFKQLKFFMGKFELGYRGLGARN
jgi:hypothetical protein